MKNGTLQKHVFAVLFIFVRQHLDTFLERWLQGKRRNNAREEDNSPPCCHSGNEICGPVVPVINRCKYQGIKPDCDFHAKGKSHLGVKAREKKLIRRIIVIVSRRMCAIKGGELALLDEVVSREHAFAGFCQQLLIQVCALEEHVQDILVEGLIISPGSTTTHIQFLGHHESSASAIFG